MLTADWDQFKTRASVGLIFVACGRMPGPYWHGAETQQSPNPGKKKIIIIVDCGPG